LWAIVNQVGENIIIEIPNDRGIAGNVYKSGKLLNITDCYADARFNHAVDRESGFKTRTILASPIPDALTAKPIGVIQAINKIGGHFTKSDEERMHQLCSMVSRVLSMSETLEDLTVSAEFQEKIFHKISLPVITLNAWGLCTKVSADAAELFGVQGSWQWAGKHIAEVGTKFRKFEAKMTKIPSKCTKFASKSSNCVSFHKVFAKSNPEVFEMWVEVVETEKEARRVIYLFDKNQIFI
jgi:hypothetical protein